MFKLFGSLTLPSKIGDFYLLTQRTCLTRLIELECCVRFSIYGHLEIIYFNCCRHHSSLVLRNRYGTANILHNREGVTQVDPLSYGGLWDHNSSADKMP